MRHITRDRKRQEKRRRNAAMIGRAVMGGLGDLTLGQVMEQVDREFKKERINAQ